MKNSPVEKKSLPFPIVGVGASAGGLESFGQFLSELPEDTGMAFVLIQHLDPTHTSLLKTALIKTTRMPILDIVHGVRLEPNTVYVLPSNVDLEISDCELHLIPRDTESGALHMPINTFFKSLAKNCERRAIGVILSGNGNDGTEGFLAIKSEGGFTFAQDPEEARNCSMPQSAVLASVVDFCLPIFELAKKLVYLSHHPYYLEVKDVEPFSTPEEEHDFERVISYIRQVESIDFAEYKDATVKRRLIRRMAFLRIETLPNYITYLNAHSPEAHALVEDVLIHVTSFFRDPDTFVKLQKVVFPQILKNKIPTAPVRMWVAGCSTGEEVYSLAIAFLEFLGDTTPKFPIQVFGSDVSDKMIEKARAGFYPDTLVSGLSAERLKRFFTKVENGYRINKVVRDLCVFVRHDLARDPPFSKLDVITCRNVLIYFNKALQKRLISTFHYCLKQPGYLTLGRTENVTGNQHFFATEDKANKIFSRTPIQSQLRFQIPKEPTQPLPLTAKASAEAQVPLDLTKTIDQLLLAEYAPSGVIINERMEVIQYRGRTSDYLEQPPGEPETNLLKMVRQGLFVQLQMAISKAKKDATVVRSGKVKVHNGETARYCHISVRPLTGLTNSTDCQYLVLFEEAQLETPFSGVRGFFKKLSRNDLEAEDLRSKKLEKELEVTKQYLQSLNDQHQKANDALATSNEEFVSGNEELQSMNEELETAKEELQSINEELTTVNDELQNSNLEVGQINNDLINLLNSVEIPILILDINRRIRRFTPHARSIINLLPTDIGRSIDDIKLNVSIKDLDGQINSAMKYDQVIDSEVQDKEGKWYRLQIRPYKTHDNKIDGTIISLFDIHGLKTEVNKAEWARDYAKSIVEGIQIPLAVLDNHLKVISANNAFYHLLDIKKNLAEYNLFHDLGINEWRIPALKSTLGEMLQKNSEFQNLQVQKSFPHIGERTLLISARPIVFGVEASNMILLIIEDITMRKELDLERARLLFDAIKAKKESDESSKQLRLIADSVPIHLLHLDRDETFLFLNKCAADAWGLPIEEMMGKTIEQVAGSEKQKVLSHYTKKVLAGEIVTYESDFQTADGLTHTYLNTYSPDKNSSGYISGFVVTGTDITERKKIENKLSDTVASLAHERELRERFIAALSHDLRTPLAVARLGAEMLMRKRLDPTQLHKISDKIVRNMERADGMIRDLLDANRLKAGEVLQLEMHACDLVKITHEVLEDFKNMHGNRFELVAQDAIPGFWNAEALRRMLENLISNGIKYGTPLSVITIEILVLEKDVMIGVYNLGNPIPEKDQATIFESFQRTESADKGSQEGWGIGLSLIKGLAIAHGGEVTVESSVAAGTTFRIKIPQDSRQMK